MPRKLNIPYPVIVEGKYDAIKLSSVMEGQILTTDGFGVFNQKEKLSLIRSLAARSPIIVLTDSDGAGKLIRSHITSAVPADRLIQLYIPQIEGKEKRKATSSADGFLGVEGMDDSLLQELLSPFSVENVQSSPRCENPLTLANLYEDGLAGRDNSSEARDRLCVSLGLPRGMSAKALLQALQLLYTYEEYADALKEKF
jgi:ribonuclease M5